MNTDPGNQSDLSRFSLTTPTARKRIGLRKGRGRNFDVEDTSVLEKRDKMRKTRSDESEMAPDEGSHRADFNEATSDSIPLEMTRRKSWLQDHLSSVK